MHYGSNMVIRIEDSPEFHKLCEYLENEGITFRPADDEEARQTLYEWCVSTRDMWQYMRKSTDGNITASRISKEDELNYTVVLPTYIQYDDDETISEASALLF